MAVGARYGWGQQLEAGVAVLRVEAWSREEQLDTMDWVDESWEQKGAEEGFA